MSERTAGSVGAWASGRWSGSPKWAPSSRATPTMHMASGRFGVIDKSKITSSSPRSSRTSVPGFVDSSRWTIPSWSSPRPSSSGASSMPSEVTPRIFLRSSTPNGSGRCAPAGARISASVLSEEANVAVEERADLVDPVADHRDPLEPEAEREPLPLLRVVADGLEHVRVDHPAAAELDPAREGADTTSLAVAEDAAHRQLRRRLGVGEVVGAEAGADGLVVEQALDEHLDRAEQVGEGDAAVDGEALHLVEHGRVARPGCLAAVRAPGWDDVGGRFVRFHGPDLHRRGVGSEHHILVAAQPHVQGVLHGARRVRGRDVERLEVVPVVLDLRTFGDAVSEAGEDVLQLALDLRDEVQMPAG